MFVDAPTYNWRALSWSSIGRPFRIERWATEKVRWEREHGDRLPAKTSWELFNRSFQLWFDMDTIAIPPTIVRRTRLDNLALLPASLLPTIESYRAIANALPPRGVLIVLPGGSCKQVNTLLTVPKVLTQHGHHV